MRPRLRRGIQPAGIEITIDELALHGFPRADRYAIAEAVQRELSAAFASGTFPGVASGAEHIDAGEFRTAPRANAASTGAGAARAIYGGLTRS